MSPKYEDLETGRMLSAVEAVADAVKALVEEANEGTPAALGALDDPASASEWLTGYILGAIEGMPPTWDEWSEDMKRAIESRVRFFEKKGTPTFMERELMALPRGTTLYTILRHVSRSGMMRVIDLVYIYEYDGAPRIGWIRDLPRLGYKLHPKHDGFKIGGCGMDMGFHLVYSVGRVYTGDGYHFNHRWI